MVQTNQSGKVIIISFICNLCIAVGKLLAFLFSRSPSMLAETLHSFGDSLNQFLLYVGFKRGKIGPCSRYPRGRGRAQYLYNLFAAQGIAIAAIYTLYHSINHWLHLSDHQYHPPGMILWIVLLVSGLIESYVFLTALKAAHSKKGMKSLYQFLQTTDDPSLTAIILEDGIAVLGVALASLGNIIGLFQESLLPDIICSLFIGLLLLFMAYYLFWSNYKFIVGTSLEKAEADKIRKFLEELPLIKHIFQFDTEVMAPGKVRLSIEVEFHGMHSLNHEQMKKNITLLKQRPQAQVLFSTYNTAQREVGNAILQLERDLQTEFPYLSIIDTETH